MPQRFESHFESLDQTELFYQTWVPETVRGVLIITHGLAEHSECYHLLAKTLCDDGWLVYAWDMRGHGRSEGKRGFARNLSSFVSDLDQFAQLVKSKHKDVNLVFLGHSLGGLVTLLYLEGQPVDCAAVVLSSPATGLSIQVPKFKETLAHVAIRWMPTLTMYNEIKYEDLTRDENMIKSYRADTLRHDKVSPGIFLGMLENFPRVLEGADKIHCPVLMQLAGDDRMVSTESSQRLFDRLANKKSQLIIYPESLHEVYNDLDHERAFADLKRFLNPYLGA